MGYFPIIMIIVAFLCLCFLIVTLHSVYNFTPPSSLSTNLQGPSPLPLPPPPAYSSIDHSIVTSIQPERSDLVALHQGPADDPIQIDPPPYSLNCLLQTNPLQDSAEFNRLEELIRVLSESILVDSTFSTL